MLTIIWVQLQFCWRGIELVTYLQIYYFLIFYWKIFEELQEEPPILYIIGPPSYKMWLQEYCQVQDLKMDRLSFIVGHALLDFTSSTTLAHENGANETFSEISK